MTGILKRIGNALGRGSGEVHATPRLAAEAAEEWLRQGLMHQQAGDLESAGESYRKVLERDPDQAEALYRLGELASLEGDVAGAIGLFERAVESARDVAQYRYALGCMLGSAGQLAQAAERYREALALDVSHAAAHNNLGHILLQQGEMALHGGAEPAAAQQDAKRLGTAWLDESLSHFQAAIENAPGYADAHLNLGFALVRRRRLDEALAHYDRALAIDPEFVDAHFNRAIALLSLGRHAEGWAEYEWRWRRPDSASKPALEQPEWDGSIDAGMTLALYTEQGFGDSIQFARYASWLAGHGIRIIVWTQAELKGLFESLPGVTAVQASSKIEAGFDAHCALLSVPGKLGARCGPLPWERPYLSANPALVEAWRARLAVADPPAGRVRRVGVVWASEPRNRIATLKSVKLAEFMPLWADEKSQFISLQKGDAARQAAQSSPPPAMVDLTDGIESFADTAAIIANLDIVISVDTAVAHLAGAMGKPVWLLLQHAPDWRWYPDAQATHWYPSMRLYRQPFPGDWRSVLSRVAQDLQAFPAAGSSAR